METVVEVKDVYKSFKLVHAVRGVDLILRRGQFTALLGPNGAGKTTLVEMIEGIQKPDKGEIRILDKSWSHHSDELHRHIGLSLQETRFIDKLNVIETLKMFASFYKLDRNRANEVMELVGLEEKKRSYVENLSGGQRQRLALGIAILNKPAVLLLDEPTTGLDPNARREIWTILRQLKGEIHTALLLTTHYMEEAEQLCDYVIIIDHGKILNEGTLDTLLNGAEGMKIAELSFEDPQQAKSNLENITEFSIEWLEGRQMGKVVFNKLDKELPQFLNLLARHNVQVQNLEIRRKTLDDLFITLTGRHLND